ncbi:alpha/beta fold hydrolase [Nocardia sp. NPDC005978]|uniref:alpha/beta fold hydrolase n=1 Tax=Nocardia sp. NPDC005978 TaxID=3156725 RepID=UPI0033BE7243
MAKIGRFKNEHTRREFLRVYAELESLWPLPATTSELETTFGTTHVRRSGSGAAVPVVLLHQVGGNGLSWHIVAERFAADRIIHAPDTIGTAGRSVQTAPVTGERDIAAWLREVLDGLGLDRVHLVGYSHGAWHAALGALHLPERLASVTLVEPGGVFTKPKASVLLKMLGFGLRGKSDKNMRAMMEWLAPGVTVSPREFELAKLALGFPMAIGWARLLKDPELRSITVPALVVYGGDTLVADPAAATRRIAEHMPHAEVEVYPGKGHGVLMQEPDEVGARIVRFIRQHDRVGADA